MTTLLAFDLETSGIDPHNDFIVTAYLGLVDPDGNVIKEQSWIIDQGKDIPEGAAAVHGFTTERIQKEGTKNPKQALEQIRRIIEVECGWGDDQAILVGFNISYDLTMLQAELRRNDLAVLPIHAIPVLDAYVADKQVDKYRKGSRKLVAVADHYGVPITAEEAHEARTDAVASARVMQAILSRFTNTPKNVARFMKTYKAEQAASFQRYLRRTDPTAVVDPGFPICEGVAAA